LSKKFSLPILVALILLAFALRVHRLGVSPFRGDEAFAVRYWAAPPAEVLHQLAWQEPHPFGAFFGFWAWKSLVGSSELAMRMLPALVDLLGVPVMVALGRRLLRDERVALVGAFLWAVNPNQLWHAQDVRNYALWSALSAVSFWLMLRAVDAEAQRRARLVDWALYILAATLSLYLFFAEAFIVAVHGLYVLIFRRRALRTWIAALAIMAVLLLPWFGQLWALAHSPYQGTATGADLGVLLTRFWPSLAFGEIAAGRQTDLLWLGVTALFGVSLLLLRQRYPRAGMVLILWIGVPAALLFLAATRVNVFRPEYVMAATPAVLLPVAWAAISAIDRGFAPARIPHPPAQKWRVWLATTVSVALTLACVTFTAAGLAGTIDPAYRKAPDWFGLHDYLLTNATADDVVIVTSLDAQTGYADPAFEYYYSGPARVITLPHPGSDIESIIRQALIKARAVWFVISGSDTEPINEALLADGVLISDQRAGETTQVRQYRARDVKALEIDHPLSLSIGGANLTGYSLIGERRTGGELTVLLFWERQPPAELTTFVHLIGPPRPDGSPLWTQDDHPPVAPGRDIYHLPLRAVPPGSYAIEIGLYDPKTNRRAMITDTATGKTLGDSATIDSITVQ
jgi:hypothetical protein